MARLAICPLNSSINLIGQSRGGIWISNQPESNNKSNSLNWMNGWRRPTTTLNSTRSAQKDGMISISRSNISKREIRYFFSNLAFDCLVMVSLEASGKALF